MAKQRGSKGGERERKPEREGSAAEHETAVDPSLLDQAALGNAVVQARMEGGEEVVASSGPDLEVVAAVAAPLVQRAIAALQLDPSDAATDISSKARNEAAVPKVVPTGCFAQGSDACGLDLLLSGTEVGLGLGVFASRGSELQIAGKGLS